MLCFLHQEEGFSCELEFLQCELTIASEQSPADYYRKSAVEVVQCFNLFCRQLWHMICI